MKKFTIFLLISLLVISIPVNDVEASPEVGQTNLFWVLSQGFFVGYYPITATCRKTGDSYYIFTEDVLVNDVSISPIDPKQILIATTSGLYYSKDGGESWRFASGSGDKIIADDYNGYGHGTLPVVHRTTVNEAFILKDGDMWCGYLDGIYQSKDDGITWSAKTRGLPNYQNSDGEVVFPETYKMVIDSRVTDYSANTDFFMGCQAGLMYWQKSKFIDLSAGLPKTSSDWDHLSVYDFTNNADTVYIASELGVYKGTLNIADSKIAWLPLGGGTVAVDSSAYDTTGWLEIYLSGVEQNTYLNLVDETRQLFWSAKVKKEGSLFLVSINSDDLYFSDDAVCNPDTLDYSKYDPAGLTVYLPPNVSVSDLKIINEDVYYLSGTGLYKIGTADTAQLVHDFGVTVYDLQIKSDSIYVGTSSGLYIASLNSETIWTKATGIISAIGPVLATDTLNYDVRSIAFNPAGDLLLGCNKGGLIKRESSGKWVNLNTGLGHRDLNPTKVDQLAAAFDSLAIETTISNWFGDLPDVDNDPKHYYLLADILDQYFLAAGDGTTFIGAFFDSTNQKSKEQNANSNNLDLIYVDSDPLDLNSDDVFNAVANALTVEIIQSQESAEPEWVYRGLAELGEHLCGLTDTTVVYTIASNNNLLAIGDISPTVTDYEHNFVFFNYLYNHYLKTPAIMREYVARTETGIEGIEAQLNALSGPTFKTLYNDFSKAVHFDMLDLPGIDSTYVFPDINVTHGTRIFDWGFGASDSPYLTPQTAWSTIYYITTGWDGNYFWCPKFSGVVTFNGEDEASYEFTTIKQKSDSFDLKVVDLDESKFGRNDDLDDFGRSYISDHTRPYQKLYFIVNVHETPDPAGTSHVIHDEVVAPSEFSMGFNQNAGASDYLNIFCFSDNRIYDDAGKADLYDTDRDAVPDLEGPIGNLIFDGDTTEIALSQFYIDDEHFDYVYNKIVDLSTITSDSANVKIDIFGENLSSSEVTTSSSGALVKINNSTEANLSIANNSAKVEIQKNSVNRQQRMTAFLSKGDLAKRLQISSEVNFPISDILFIGPIDLNLQKTIGVRMKINMLQMEDEDFKPVLYRQVNDKLEAIAIVEPSADGEIYFETDRLGSFQVYMSKESIKTVLSPLPKVFALQQNYPNPFNQSTTIRYQIPKTSNVKIEVYNLLGTKVRTLINETKTPGYYRVQWNGFSDQNHILPSGIYIYKLITNDYSKTEKMMYLK